MINALSFDVEEYFCVTNFEKFIKRDDWGEYPSRVAYHTEKILEILGWHSVKATFFILGWVAQRQQRLIKKIKDDGHEIGVHSWHHKLIYQQEPEEFRAEVRDTKQLLEDIAQTNVVGFRGTTFSITKESLWALDVLLEEGFKYDSTIFPIIHDRYGIKDFPLYPHVVRSHGDASLWEFPLTTFKLFNVNLPISGGGYLRLLNYMFTKKILRSINTKQKRPFVIYVHPWELDTIQPLPPHIPKLLLLRHSLGIRTVEKKLKKLLEDFHFSPLKEVLNTYYDAGI